MKKADLTVGEERWVTIGQFVLVRIADLSVPGSTVLVEPVQRLLPTNLQRIGLTPAEWERRKAEWQEYEHQQARRRAERAAS